MRTMRGIMAAVALTIGATGARAAQRGLDVEVWTDRGHDGVYQPGDAMEVRTRTSDDAYLLVYEIDAEGRVNLLYPDRGSRGFVDGRETLKVPSERSNLELVVEGPVGQGFVVAVASREPFRDLPWYLRPYDVHAEGVGYAGEPDDEEGVTREGRIVGDPFVAMERIRRRVVRDADAADAFATAYTSYYVHHEVRYPRYLCNDCHRPNRWTWWDGFDPYYAQCSVFDFRVNWGWGWGPSYWFGAVPYYYYVYRADCPPRYRPYSTRTICYSSWDGWPRWSSLWGGSLRRYKSDPPVGYIPPSKYKDQRVRSLPPGFASFRDVGRGRHAGSLAPASRGPRDAAERGFKGDRPTAAEELGRSGSSRSLSGVRQARGLRPRDPGAGHDPRALGRGGHERAPGLEGSRESLRRDAIHGSDRGHGGLRPREIRGESPAIEPRQERPREEPRIERPREHRDDSPKWEKSRESGRPEPRGREIRTEKRERGRNGRPER